MKIPHSARSPLWIVLGVLSLGLFAVVVMAADWATFSALVDNMHLGWFALAIGLFLLEGVLSAVRIKVFTPGRPPLAACLRLNAWYVLALIILPARLGDVAGMALFQRYLGQSTGSAVINVLAQRLLDLMVLGGVFVILGVVFAGRGSALAPTLMVLAVVVAVILVMRQLPTLLALAYTLLPKIPALRAVRRQVLAARSWYRHRLGAAEVSAGIVATVGRWIANLMAIVAVLVSLDIDLVLAEKLLVAASHNALAIIPLHSVGGVGITDAGLTALLSSLGQPLPMAAGAALVLRIAIICAPPLFWVMVMTVTATWHPTGVSGSTGRSTGKATDKTGRTSS